MEQRTWNIPWNIRLNIPWNTKRGTFPGTWNLEHGTWNIEPGTWIKEQGTWDMKHSTEHPMENSKDNSM